jgi:glucose/arabinose dehydrogenase
MGGALDFGKDGKLYVATGYNVTPDKAQQLTNLFGKMLRINKDGTIPTDNPFYATASGKNRAIWALGLRNPFKFAVQPTTGTIFINDVGEDAWEEINRGARRQLRLARLRGRGRRSPLRGPDLRLRA